jgi:hypothetical protein
MHTVQMYFCLLCLSQKLRLPNSAKSQDYSAPGFNNHNLTKHARALSPIKIVEGIAELLGSERGELGPVDIVVVDPLVAQRDHLPYNWCSGSRVADGSGSVSGSA